MLKVQKNVFCCESANGTVAGRDVVHAKSTYKIEKKKRDEPIGKRKRLKERSKNRQHDSNKKGISFAYYMNAMGPNWFGGPRTRRILLELQKSMAE